MNVYFKDWSYFMKTTIRKTVFLLSVLTLALCCFFSCNKNNNPPDTEEPPAPDVVIDVSTLANHTIIKRDEAGSDESELATLLSARIEELGGVKLSVKSDFLYPGEAPGEYEILFGETNRAESAEFISGLKYNDFIITQSGNKLIIAGVSTKALEKAVEHIASSISDGKLTIKQGKYVYNAEYKYDDIKLGDVSIGNYSLVYGADKSTVAANIIRDAVGEACGVTLPIKKHNTDVSDYEIVVGASNRGNNVEACDYYSYRIIPQDKAVWINSYDVYALNAAARHFGEVIMNSNGALALNSLSYEYVNPTNKELTENIDGLYMRWAEYWQAPEGMLDYKGKLASYINPGDRLMTVAHRADAQYYPENSLEAIISFYKMGGDVVEIDLHATRDGIIILMHDATLTRTTNAAEFMGKTIDGIKFPDTAYVNQWTYEQITYLKLKEGYGGKDAILTNFKVPTLAEALKVCKNRLLVLPDKAQKGENGEPGCWRYANVNGVQEGNLDFFLYDAMKEADNYESILLSYGYLTVTEAVRLQKWLYNRTGVMPYIMLRANSGQINVYNALLLDAMPNSFAIQMNGSFNSETFPNSYKDAYKFLKEKNCLMLGWTIVDETYPFAVDGKKSWDQMYELGYRMIMTNKYLDLVKYAAAIYEDLGE